MNYTLNTFNNTINAFDPSKDFAQHSVSVEIYGDEVQTNRVFVQKFIDENGIVYEARLSQKDYFDGKAWTVIS